MARKIQLTNQNKCAIVTACKAHSDQKKGKVMSEEDLQLVMMLSLKHGGIENLIDLWLYDDAKLTGDEKVAVTNFMEDDDQYKPFNAKLQNNNEYPFLTVDLSINSPEED